MTPTAVRRFLDRFSSMLYTGRSGKLTSRGLPWGTRRSVEIELAAVEGKAYMTIV